MLSATRHREGINKTLDSVIREGGLFVTDYAVLDSVKPKEKQYLCARLIEPIHKKELEIVGQSTPEI